MLFLSSCNQAPLEISTEPTLQITTAQTAFRKGQEFSVTLEIYSPKDSNVNVAIAAPKNLGISQEPIQVTIGAGQTKSLELRGTPKRSGYYNITANATGSQWQEPAADMLGFNVASNNTAAASAGAYPQAESGLETLEKHLENLPKISTPEEYAALSAAQTIDDVKDLDGVRLDSRLENLQFTKPDGTKTEPFNTAISYLPDTGSGKPRPEELQPPSTAARAKANARPQGWCGLGDWATMVATVSYNGKTLPLPFTKVSVWDDNGWMGSTPITAGYTDASGSFSFRKPSCDWGAWWDYTGPDIYFLIETLDSHEIGVNNILVPLYVNTYSVRTGTNWEGASNFYYVDVLANDSSSGQALWLYRMVQAAQEFNVGAGGDGASYFPIRIVWPTRLPGGNFAPVARLEILGSDWFYPYIAWHEFGHNMMYRTARPSGAGGYTWAYDFGAFSIVSPAFAWGNHDIDQQENVELAYNEGFANYFYLMLQDNFNFNFAPWTNDSQLRGCNYFPSCAAHNVGNENESRVSTFFYRYTQEVVKPFNGITAQAAFGKVRARLWDIGAYNLSFSTAWSSRLKTLHDSLPAESPYRTLTKSIADATFFTLAGVP